MFINYLKKWKVRKGNASEPLQGLSKGQIPNFDIFWHFSAARDGLCHFQKVRRNFGQDEIICFLDELFEIPGDGIKNSQFNSGKAILVTDD